EVRRASQPVTPGCRPAMTASVQRREIAEDQALAAGRNDERMQVLAQFRRLFLEPTAEGADAGVDDVDEIIGQEFPFYPAAVPQHGLRYGFPARRHQFADDGEFKRG